MVVPDVFESQKRVVALGLHGDEALFHYFFGVVLSGQDALLHILVHSFSGDANQVDVEVESQLGFEGDHDALFAFGIDDASWGVKLKVLRQDLGQVVQLSRGVLVFGSFLFILWSHFQLYENVAVASVVNCGLHGFVKSDGDGSEINVLWLNLDDAITSSTDNFQNILFKRR